MGVLHSLGLRRPGAPQCSADGRFQIAGVTVVNPMHDRRAHATIEVAGDSIAEFPTPRPRHHPNFPDILRCPDLSTCMSICRPTTP